MTPFSSESLVQPSSRSTQLVDGRSAVGGLPSRRGFSARTTPPGGTSAHPGKRVAVPTWRDLRRQLGNRTALHIRSTARTFVPVVDGAASGRPRDRLLDEYGKSIPSSTTLPPTFSFYTETATERTTSVSQPWRIRDEFRRNQPRNSERPMRSGFLCHSRLRFPFLELSPQLQAIHIEAAASGSSSGHNGHRLLRRLTRQP